LIRESGVGPELAAVQRSVLMQPAFALAGILFDAGIDVMEKEGTPLLITLLNLSGKISVGRASSSELLLRLGPDFEA